MDRKPKVDNFSVRPNGGGCGGGLADGSNPNFSLYSLNWGRSNFTFVPRLIFVSGLIFKVIVFLGIQFWVVEQTCKTGK